MYHDLFIHSSADRHLGCFHVLDIVNSAAINIGIFVSFSFMVSSGYMPSSGVARSYGGFIPSFLRMHFPGGSDGIASACNVRDLGSILGSGRSCGEGNGNLLQYSYLGNPMDGGAR